MSSKKISPKPTPLLDKLDEDYHRKFNFHIIDYTQINKGVHFLYPKIILVPDIKNVSITDEQVKKLYKLRKKSALYTYFTYFIRDNLRGKTDILYRYFLETLSNVLFAFYTEAGLTRSSYVNAFILKDKQLLEQYIGYLYVSFGQHTQAESYDSLSLCDHAYTILLLIYHDLHELKILDVLSKHMPHDLANIVMAYK